MTHALSLTLRRSVLLGAACAFAPPVLRAQSDKPVKFILPVSAGSGVDAIMRAASAQIGKALGQPVVIENQPGAGGVVGTQALVRSAPDGLTLSLVSNNHVVYPSVLKSLPFDAIADITPIAIIGATPFVLVANNKLPAKNLGEFVAMLKASPGRYNYASSGNGTVLQLAAELFKDVTGTFSTHIPYRGFGPMLTDIVGGQVDWGVGALPAVLGQLKAGNLKGFCISGPARIPAAPEVPTSIEAGTPKFQIEGWIGCIGPKGMAPETVKRVHTALAAAFATAEVKEAMFKQGNSINVSTPEVAVAHFKSEMLRYAALVKKAGVVPT